MRFKPTKQQQNEAMAGVFELYHNPINENRYDHYIRALMYAVMLYPNNVSMVEAIAERLNSRLIRPLSLKEEEQARMHLRGWLQDDLFD